MSNLLNQWNQHTYVVIMAGGIGSRFWPISRSAYPKQFLDILGLGKTLIQQTANRFKAIVEVDHIFVVTANEYIDITKAQLPELPEENIVGEPSRKNTAPCIAYIAFKLLQKDPLANIIIAPSDHLIVNEIQFIENCKNALDYSRQSNSLITLGIKPTHPNTGYGYIEYNKEEGESNLYRVSSFKEKPDKETATLFLNSGNYLWNAGIFVWRADSIIKAIQKHLPEVFELFDSIKARLNTVEEYESLKNIYPICKNISIDVGVMEKADNVFVMPATFDWSDLGTWNSAWENMEKDGQENAVVGDNTVMIEAANCVIRTSNEKLVLVQGLKNYIVVDTADVLLICDKDNEQKIKEYVVDIKNKKGEKFL